VTAPHQRAPGGGSGLPQQQQQPGEQLDAVT